MSEPVRLYARGYYPPTRQEWAEYGVARGFIDYGAAANVLVVNDMQAGPPDMLAEIGAELAAPYVELANRQLDAALGLGEQ